MITITENTYSLREHSYVKPPEYHQNTNCYENEYKSTFYDFGEKRPAMFCGIREEKMGFYAQEILEACKE